jgi:ParB family chromosome partitioning protein
MVKRMSETAMLNSAVQSVKNAAVNRQPLSMNLTPPASKVGNLSAEEMLARAEEMRGVERFNPPALAHTNLSGTRAKLDPRTIRQSRYANRFREHLAGPAFNELKASLAKEGGNKVPIEVRRLGEPEGEYHYEIAYGHRRHQGCLELGLLVDALIVDLDDKALFALMDQENRNRLNPSAWEQGMAYARALEYGLYASARQLAEDLNADLGQVGKALAIARLPKQVIDAFSSPLDIQYRHAKPLKDAITSSPEAIIARAAKVVAEGEKLTASEVLKRLLTDEQVAKGALPSHEEVRGKGGQVGKIQFAADKRRAIVTVDNIDPSRFVELQQLVSGFLNRGSAKR